MLIVIGISYFISSILMSLQQHIREWRDPFAYVRTIRFYLELQQFLIVFIYLPILISLLLAVFTFISVKKANFKGTNVVLQKYTFFGGALISMSILPLHSLLFLSIDPILSLVIGIGGCVIAYYFMHRLHLSSGFTEFLYFILLLSILGSPGSISWILELWTGQRWMMYEIFVPIVQNVQYSYVIKSFIDWSLLSFVLVFPIGATVSGWYAIRQAYHTLEVGSPSRL